MGKAIVGGSEFRGNIPTVSPEQQQLLSSILGSIQPGAQESFQDFLQPPSAEQYPEMFDRSFTQPAIQQLQQQVIPALQERFQGLNEAGSGALNRALSQAASDVSTGLGQQMMQQYNMGQQRRMQALGLLPNILGQKTFEPWVTQNPSLLSGILAGAGPILGGML